MWPSPVWRSWARLRRSIACGSAASLKRRQLPPQGNKCHTGHSPGLITRSTHMSPQDVADAITNALVQGGSQWLVSTLVAFLPVLWTMSLILQIGRPYVLRTLRRCGLRLGADVWWMSYLLMRDATLLATFALSWLFFEPNIVVNQALPITGSLAA